MAQLRRELAEARAQQAELLIENGRLRGDLGEAREQETATAELLRLLSHSAGDIQPVLNGIVERAARLCDASDAVVFLEVGEKLRPVSVMDVGLSPRPVTYEEAEALVAAEAQRLGRRRPTGTLDVPLDDRTAPGRAHRTRRVVHIREFSRMTELGYPDFNREFFAQRGEHSGVFVPLLRDDASLGVLIAMRRQTEPFTDRHIGLLQSFAAQAVIAIEHARLFTELQERLEEQTATAGVLRVISESPTDLHHVLDTLVDSVRRLCDSSDAFIVRGTLDGVRLAAASGPMAAAVSATYEDRPLFPVSRASVTGRTIVERRTQHVLDVRAVLDTEFPDAREATERFGTRTYLAVPLLREGAAVGAMAAVRSEVRAFTDQQVKLLETFADQAVIAIENARLFRELRESNATLKEALEQQTATGDVLRAIAASPQELERPLLAIGASAVRLCGADTGVVSLRYGDRLRIRVAVRGEQDVSAEFRDPDGDPLDPRWVPARAVLERRTIHVPDFLAARGEFPVNYEMALRRGGRTGLAVPLIRGDEAIGYLGLVRDECRPFADDQIRLIESFADQAAIAVENARLFSELQERDDRRRQELERASAIQQRLLPNGVQGWPGVLEVAVRFRPAVETSGDFYDVLRLTPAAEGALPPLQIAVGDVAGKGMAAALVTALARSALRASESVPTAMASPAGTLRAAGQRLHRDVGGQHFVACALAVVEPPGPHHTGPLLRLANAAQVPVLLVRDGRADDVEPAGYRLPLGAQADGAYRDAEAELRPGDLVILSSDGLVEAPALSTATVGRHLSPPAREGELFGFERLAASASHWSVHAPTAERVAAGIWSDLTAWCGGQSHHDDMTLLVLRVPEPRG